MNLPFNLNRAAMTQAMSSHYDKMETLKTDHFDPGELNWTVIDPGSEQSDILWRIFLWGLTILAIGGMVAALFWWQIDRGVIPSSALSDVQVVRDVTLPRSTEEAPEKQNPTVETLFPKPQTTGQYMVLAGSFIQEENARRIFDKLVAVGVPVHSRQAMVSGQMHTHLLVGPYQRQDSAEQAIAMIRERTGLPVDYTTLDLDSDKEAGSELLSSQAPSSVGEGTALLPDQFIVLAGSFTDRIPAKRVQKRLQESAIQAEIKEVSEQDRIFYHVVVGPYQRAMQASRMVEDIRKKTGILAETTQVL